ncbi:MAG: hypothetical protein GOU98_01125 [Candidatus Altiarchaeota archaeon]|nr:hypothetical protein [Candidatus Altiarchaeota archaeon]
MVSALLAYLHPQIARWSAILSFAFISEQFYYSWLPGIMFSWSPPYESIVFAAAIICMTALVYARDFSKEQISMLIIIIAGIIGFLGTNSIIQAFFFLELIIFPTFYLLLKEDKNAAFKYFGFMQTASILILAGLLSGGILGSMILTLGFAIKMGIFPFHSWVPDAHSQAPTPVSALLSSLIVALGAFGILIYSTTPEILVPIGIISAIYGAIGASAEHDLKRLLAYSTVSQMGFVAVALWAAPEAVIIFLIAHALAKSSLFFSVGEFIKNGVNTVSGGVYSKTLFVSVLIACLSLIGFPPLLGFMAEFSILTQLMTKSPVGVIFFLFAIFPSIFYIERLISMFFRKSPVKLESALPLIIALLLLPGVIPWMSS